MTKTERHLFKELKGCVEFLDYIRLSCSRCHNGQASMQVSWGDHSIIEQSRKHIIKLEKEN